MKNGTFKEVLKKGDIVEFEFSNVLTVKAVVLSVTQTYFDYYESGVAKLGSYRASYEYFLYAQNRIFSAYNKEDHVVQEDYDFDLDKYIEIEESTFTPLKYDTIIVEYCIIPEADKMVN